MMKRILSWLPWDFSRGNDHPYSGLPLLLVTGVGRSGTTVMRKSLGLHPAIDYTGGENNVLYDLLGVAQHNCTYPSRKVAMRVSQDEYDRLFKELVLKLLWPSPVGGTKAPRLLMAFSDLSPDRGNYLRNLFPNLTIVYIVRNGIEVVASRMLYEGFRDRPFDWQCQVWAATREFAEWGGTQDGFVVVRHEELTETASAERALGRVFECAGVDFERRCLESLLHTRYHPTILKGESADAAGNMQHRAERWRHWTHEQRCCFEDLCAPTMAYFDYEIPAGFRDP